MLLETPLKDMPAGLLLKVSSEADRTVYAFVHGSSKS
jgi:hypothetical protein